MADSTTEKIKSVEKQETSKQIEFQTGTAGHVAASGASAPPPPLDGAAVARIQRSPQNALRSDMLALQRAVGNRAVAALVRGETKEVAIQAKLEVGPVNDVYEQEADRIARQVTSDIAQRKPANAKSRDDEAEEAAPQPGLTFNIKRMVQRKRAESSESKVRADGSFTANSDVQSRLHRMQGGGRPLPDSIRRQMEPRFGADFGGVRIHTGGDAVQLSRDIGARAFTHGSHIAFGSGNFNPNSSEGRHLLAHELTHTIQQSGARPLTQRSPKGTIQRGIFDSIRNFFSRRNRQEPVIGNEITGPIPGNAQEIQADAKQRVEEADQTAGQLLGTAYEDANRKLNDHSYVSREMEESGGDRARLEVGKNAIASMKAGDERLKSFIAEYKRDLEKVRNKVLENRRLIDLSSVQIANFANANDPQAIAMALESRKLASEAEQLVQQLRESHDQEKMSSQADTEVAFARSGMTSQLFGYSARSIPAAEKAASDSVLDLAEIKGKVQNYFLYLDTDRRVLQSHTDQQAEQVQGTYGLGASSSAQGSAAARAGAGGDPGMLTDEQAFQVAGWHNMQAPEGDGDDSSEQDRQMIVMKNMASGRKQGLKMMEQAQQLNQSSQGNSPTQAITLSKEEKKYAKAIKRLEIRHMLLIKATARMPIAKDSLEKVESLYTETMQKYETIDVLRKGEHTPETIDAATRIAGEARANVAQAAVHMAKLRKFKEEVYNESQKYEKYVGPRAMSKTKRRLKRTAGFIISAGSRALTGGLYRIDADETGGGYQVEFKGKSLKMEIERKGVELQRLVQGVKGGPVHGLGRTHAEGVAAFVFFKKVSFALQIIRDIASACALWVTILTLGAGAPVGAVFASLAFFTALAKAAVDLLLLVWSGIGLNKTNDPKSRMVLRAEFTQAGLAFGEGAFMGGSAGLVMGLSGQSGILGGQQQLGSFSEGSVSGTIGDTGGQVAANLGTAQSIPILGNIGAGVGANVGRYGRHYNLESMKHDRKVEEIRKARKAIRHVTNPAREAFDKLAQLALSKREGKKAGLVVFLPKISKSIEELGGSVDQVEEPQPEAPQL